MPKISTHLHLALKLSKIIKIKDLNFFLLGNAYPDCWKISVEKSLRLHYKDDASAPCCLEKFKENEEMDDFNFGYYFHLWVDNRIMEVDAGDISKDDCLICDMASVAPLIRQLEQYNAADGREHQAVQNILALASEPLPLYEVPEDKKKRYDAILDTLADEFAKEHLIKAFPWGKVPRRGG